MIDNNNVKDDFFFNKLNVMNRIFLNYVNRCIFIYVKVYVYVFVVL